VQGALSWSLDESDASRIDGALGSLLAETGAGSALLIDRTGQLIAFSQAASDVDMIGFAALAAADFAANEQLALLLGETAFSSLSHQGPQASLHLASVARRAILAVVFEREVPLGLVRVKVRRALPTLQRLLEQTLATSRAERSTAFGGVWQNAAETEIDRFFGGA
jgi:predicted regulator of Ras-like GTPase activity (Roadblock/LC7/MglB family)